MNNRRYVILAAGKLFWVSSCREAERVYVSFEHARMEVWENKNDHNSARFLKKK